MDGQGGVVHSGNRRLVAQIIVVASGGNGGEVCRVRLPADVLVLGKIPCIVGERTHVGRDGRNRRLVQDLRCAACGVPVGVHLRGGRGNGNGGSFAGIGRECTQCSLSLLDGQGGVVDSRRAVQVAVVAGGGNGGEVRRVRLPADVLVLGKIPCIVGERAYIRRNGRDGRLVQNLRCAVCGVPVGVHLRNDIARLQSIRYGRNGRTLGGDGHRACSWIVANLRLDGGIRPVDVAPSSINRCATTHHQGEQAVGIGRKPGVLLAISHRRTVESPHCYCHRDVALIVHYLVLRVAHHRLVSQLLIGWCLCKSHR